MQNAEQLALYENSRTAARRILFIQYTNPAAYPPLEHSSRILADAGWQVMFLGVEAPGASMFRFPPHDRIHVRNISHSPAGWKQKLHYIRFALWVMIRVLHWRPRWVYASEHLSCPIAWLISLLPSVSVIYHEHDSPLSSQGTVFHKVSMLARRKLAHRATLCILPNRHRSEAFTSAIGCRKPALTVWNCPRQDEVIPPRKPKIDEALKIYYHGNLSPDLLPPTLIPAIAKLSGLIRLTVVGYETNGFEGYINKLRASAREFGVEDSIEFLPPRPRRELWPIMRQHDVGLALMPPRSDNFNLLHLIGASNKVFDYMACGLALLVNDSPEWRNMYVDSGFGLACDPGSSESIAMALRTFLHSQDLIRSMGDQGRKKILSDWNYETQFSPVLERVKGSSL